MKHRRIAQQQDVWASLGESDPDWGVLTERRHRHGGWGDDLDTFYASGEAAVEDCLAVAPVRNTASALDFGAGTGRLSIALARRFRSVTSADISAGMLSTLRARAESLGLTNIRAVHPAEIGTGHDFAISLLVLQHLPSLGEVAAAITAIAAALGTSGVAVIELPERINTRRARLQPRLRIYRALRAVGIPHRVLHRGGLSGISMLTVSEGEALRQFASAGLTVLRRVPRPDHDYEYVRWVVQK